MTDRRQRRNFLKKKEKDVQRIQRELNKVFKEINSLPMVQLEKPVWKGWKKYFVLKKSDDPRLLKKTDLALRCLDLINTTIYCQDKSFTRWEKNHGMRRKNPMEHKLRYLYKHEWKKLPEDLAECFRETLIKGERGYFTAYEFRWPRMFVEKIDKHYVTQMRMIDPELISRKEELNQMLYGPDWRVAEITKNTRYWRNKLIEPPSPSIEEFE